MHIKQKQKYLDKELTRVSSLSLFGLKYLIYSIKYKTIKNLQQKVQIEKVKFKMQNSHQSEIFFKILYIVNYSMKHLYMQGQVE